eukprot:sb/3468329/
MLRYWRNRQCIRSPCISLCRRFSSQKKRSPYDVLGLKQSATKAEIKSSYIGKAKKCHPDLFPNDERKKEEFQELQEAYEVRVKLNRECAILSDSTKRAQWNQQQHYGQQQGPAHPGQSNPYGRGPPPPGYYKPYRPGGSPDPRTPREQWMEQMLRMHAEQARADGVGGDNEKWNEAKERSKRLEKIFFRIMGFYLLLVLLNIITSLTTSRPELPTMPLDQQEAIARQMQERMRGNHSGRSSSSSHYPAEIQELIDSWEEDGKKK